MSRVREFLEIGKGCGLDHIEEAYNNYMLHYDLFFIIDKYAEQYKEFIDELHEHNLLETTDEGLMLLDISIDEALERIDVVGQTDK